MAPVTSVGSLEAISGAFMGLCILAVLLRFCARKRHGAPLLSDDWSMLAALACVLAFSGCTIALVRVGAIGWGEHPYPDSEIPEKWYTDTKIIYSSDIALNLALALIKVSALLLYKRIFCVSTRYNRPLFWAIVGTIAVLAAWAITFSFLAGFQCRDIRNDWQPAKNAKDCAIGQVYAYGLFVSDFILDVWIIALPIPSILSLNMTPKKKAGFVGIFMVALVGLAASIVRLVVFLKVAVLKSKLSIIKSGEDFDAYIYFYNTLEVGMMLISINIPVLWSLFSKFAPELVMKVARSMTSLASQRSTNRSASGGSAVADTHQMSDLTDAKHGTSYVDISSDGKERHQQQGQSITVDRTVQVSAQRASQEA